MHPYYTHFPGDDFNLTSDDIDGIQSIYGNDIFITDFAIQCNVAYYAHAQQNIKQDGSRNIFMRMRNGACFKSLA